MTGYLGITTNPYFISGDKNCQFLVNWHKKVKDNYHYKCCYLNRCRTISLLDFYQKFLTDDLFSNFPAIQSRVKLTAKEEEEISKNIDSKPVPQAVNSNLQYRNLPFHLILKTEDSGILSYRMGEDNYLSLMNIYLRLAQKELSYYNARIITWEKDLLLVGFGSALQAISCLMALKNSMKVITGQIILKMVLKMRLNGEKNIEEIRGHPFFFYKIEEIKPILEQKVLSIAGENKWPLLLNHEDVNIVKMSDQKYLISLFQIIKENWHNPFFNVSSLCSKMSSSRSRLYRRCKKVTGISPIMLIKEYRLQACLKSLKCQKSITSILYDSGFNSPSYFSRCFKNRFGLSPYLYQKHFNKNIRNN